MGMAIKLAIGGICEFALVHNRVENENDTFTGCDPSKREKKAVDTSGYQHRKVAHS